MNYFILHFSREIRQRCRQLSSLSQPLFFFILVICLLPLTVDPQHQAFQQIGAAMIWLAVMLSVLLSLPMLFSQDYESGVLQQIILSPKPLVSAVLAKIISHWLLSSVPIILLSPLIAIFLSINNLATLFLLLLLTTPVLSLIGSIGASLTVGLKQAHLLVILIILPLYVPLLIFSTAALTQSQLGLNIRGHLYLLTSILMITLVLAPIVTSAILKTNIKQAN